MAKYKRVYCCRDCGKIYPRSFPQYCSRCGLQLAFNDGAATGAAEKVRARRTITGRWKVKGPAEPFRPKDIQHKYVKENQNEKNR